GSERACKAKLRGDHECLLAFYWRLAGIDHRPDRCSNDVTNNGNTVIQTGAIRSAGRKQRAGLSLLRRTSDPATAAPDTTTTKERDMAVTAAQGNGATRLSHATGPSEPPIRDLTLGELLAWAAETTPDRLALIAGVPDPAARRQWTYAELHEQAQRTARALRS